MKQPSLHDPVLVFAGVATIVLVYIAAGRTASSAVVCGISAGIALFLCRVRREFKFQRWTNRALRDSERTSRILADGCADVIAEIDVRAVPRCLYVSTSSRTVIGRAAHELVGREPYVLVHPEDAPALAEFVKAVWSGGLVAPLLCRGPAGGPADVYLEASGRISSGGETILLALRDVTRQRLAEIQLDRAQNQLRTLMMCDELTGIANRRCLDAVMHKETRRLARTRQPMALLVIGVDRFATFSDIYGQGSGSALLARLGQAVSSGVGRPADLVARIGDQEFAMLLPETDACGALEVAGRVRMAVNRLRVTHCGNPERLVTVSIGGATTHPQGPQAGPMLMHEAQSRLVHAMEAGGDRVCMDDADESLGSFGSGESRLRHAVAFQPDSRY